MAKTTKAKAKKPHWTQTPRGRSIMRRNALAQSAKRQTYLERAAKHSTNEPTHGPSFHAAYLLGKVETQIEYYCVGKGISPATLAAELGKLLRHSEGR